MKEWQDFLLWVVAFVLWDTLVEFIKSGTKTGVVSDWFFVVFSIAVFVLAWVGVFFGLRILKDKKIKKTSKKINFLIWAVDFVLFWSVFAVFDVARYLLEYGMLNGWSLLVVCILFMFIGWAGGRLEGLLFKPKKQSKN